MLYAEPCETLVTQRAMSYQPSMTMRFCRPAFAIATLLSGAAAFASVELVRPQPDTVIFAMMSAARSASVMLDLLAFRRW